MRTTSPALALRQARLQLLEHGDFPVEGIDERVARSWRRSLAAGLSPGGRLLDTEHAGGVGLRDTLAFNVDLLSHSRPVMEFLFEQVRHSQGMVILADQRGTLMHTLGHPDFLGKAERVALSCGASWQEQYRGTNAIGTALIEASGVEIHGGEHFLERNGFLTCTAAPIMSAKGELMGIIDISGDHRSGHPHTLGLVCMAASMIENRLLSATCRRQIRLHLHAQLEGIGSVAEGIVVLSDDGWIVGANRAGLTLLHLTAHDLGAAPLASTMDVRLDELLARQQRRPGQPTQVHLADGAVCFVQVQTDKLAFPAIALAAASSPGATPKDALSRLDTGDLRWRSATDKARRVMDKPIPLLNENPRSKLRGIGHPKTKTRGSPQGAGNLPAVIQGESGVGKELFARALHDSGARRDGPFVAINCAALPEHLIEAELFGYAPGAFTGARREGSLGRLREAHGGTLFLDEIGDMPLGLQTRLLRVLQERRVTPLGAGRSVDVDFALICATHCKLREEAERGSFRSDLYYRINGLTVQLPALRERTDFQALTQRLLRNLHPELDLHIAPDLLARLGAHAWPGNLRQYVNLLRTASAMLDPHETCIAWQHLPDDLLQDLSPQAGPTVQPAPLPATLVDASHNLGELSRLAMRLALDASRGNMSQAARRLGISRQMLYRKLND